LPYCFSFSGSEARREGLKWSVVAAGIVDIWIGPARPSSPTLLKVVPQIRVVKIFDRFVEFLFLGGLPDLDFICSGVLTESPQCSHLMEIRVPERR
jgi:hypothetical protein